MSHLPPKLHLHVEIKSTDACVSPSKRTRRPWQPTPVIPVPPLRRSWRRSAAVSAAAAVRHGRCRGASPRAGPRPPPVAPVDPRSTPDRQVRPSRTRNASCEVSLSPLTAHLAERGADRAGGGGWAAGFGEGRIPNLPRYTVRRGWSDIGGCKWEGGNLRKKSYLRPLDAKN